jgi:hypothetical protein
MIGRKGFSSTSLKSFAASTPYPTRWKPIGSFGASMIDSQDFKTLRLESEGEERASSLELKSVKNKKNKNNKLVQAFRGFGPGKTKMPGPASNPLPDLIR